MSKITQSHKTKNKSNKITSKNRRLVFVILGVIITSLVVWPFVRNSTLYTVNKNDTRADIESLLDQVHPTAHQLYSDIIDLGCDSGNSVGLKTIIHCELAGYKYYQKSGNLSTDLHSIDTYLTHNGWRANVPTAQQFEEYKQLLNDEAEGSTGYIYTKNDTNRNLTLELYKNGSSLSTPTITALITNKKIRIDSPDGGIFGIRVVQTYWSCDNESIFKLPCPNPPSEAQVR